MTRRSLQFIALCFVLTWSIAFAFWAAGGKWIGLPMMLVGAVIMWMPALAAIVLQKLVYREPLKDLGVTFRINSWWVLAWLIPLVGAMLAFGIGLLMPGTSYSPGMEGMYARFADLMKPEDIALMREQVERAPVNPFLMTLLQAMIAGVTVNALAAFGEELGWRGFLQRELEPMGFWRSSLLIGFIWGLWHAPLILQGHNYPNHRIAGVGLMIVFTMLLSPIIGFVRQRARSVVAAAIFHGTLNAAAGLPLMFIVGGHDLLIGYTGLAGLLTLALLNVLLVLFDARRPESRKTRPGPLVTG